MTKVFPKSRICVIDAVPSIEIGVKMSIDFASKHNVSLNTGDGRRLLIGFCLRSIENAYRTTQSPFPKVLCVSKKTANRKVINFIGSFFKGIMDNVPIPYCGEYELNSPDLECAAEQCLKKHKPKQNYIKFIEKLKLRSIN